MVNQLDIFNQQLVQIPTVESANSFTTLDEIFEDFNLIRHQVINGEHYFVLNDFAEHVVKSSRAVKYVSDLKNELKKKNFQLSDHIVPLKFQSNDLKFYKLSCVSGETLLRICQEINSPRFEGLRQWLSGLGWRELKEIKDPGLTLDRAYKNYKKQGKTDEWINIRFKGTVGRNIWTAAVVESPCPNPQIGKLTNIEYSDLIGCTAQEFRMMNGLKDKANVRNHLDEKMLDALRIVELSGAERVKKFDHSTQAQHEATAKLMAIKAKQIYDLTMSILD